jgi:RNA polymerase sigma-70 factor, ECF subfamily
MTEARKRQMDADLEAIERCLAGDREAFRVLLDRHQRVVYNLAYHILGDRSEAEDAAQEAFMKAYMALGTFRRESSFKSWLCQITNRLCIDKLRARKTQPKQVALDEVMEPAEPERAEAIITQEEIQQALAKLPAHLKSVLILRHIEDLSYEEISAALEIPIGTVKTHLHRGRSALKAELEKLQQNERAHVEGR